MNNEFGIFLPTQTFIGCIGIWQCISWRAKEMWKNKALSEKFLNISPKVQNLFWRIVRKCKNWKGGGCVKYWSWLGCCAHELILPVVTCLRTEQPNQNCSGMGKWHKRPNSLLRSCSVYGSKGMESHFSSLV